MTEDKCKCDHPRSDHSNFGEPPNLGVTGKCKGLIDGTEPCPCTEFELNS